MATDNSYTVAGFLARGNRGLRRYSLSLVILGLLIVAWEITPPYINAAVQGSLPTFSESVYQTLVAERSAVIGATITTMTEVVVGFCLSVLIGITLGVIFAESYVIRQSMLPSLIFVYSIPHAIMAPLFIVWFGTGLISIGLFAAWFGFFTVFVNTITGLNQVEEEFIQLGEVFGATEAQMMRHVKFWAALPHISGGIKVAVQQSIIGVIIAEFIATGQGLGWQILAGQKFFNEALMFGVIAVLIVIAVSLYKFVSVAIDYLSPGPGSIQT